MLAVKPKARTVAAMAVMVLISSKENVNGIKLVHVQIRHSMNITEDGTIYAAIHANDLACKQI